ncbi:MAG: hypothetical protein Q7T20_19775 [Saprospiraceae bacterium]|nr:hypothetical protein [Saprospiraceae bacterium]
MKNFKLVLGLLLFTTAIFGQTVQDSKDYISEKVGGSNPLPNYANKIFFTNILRPDAEMLVGRKLSDDEFNHLFIYARDVYVDDNRSKWAWTVAQSVDIRGITKVSATRTTGQQNFYTITVYLDENHLAKQYSESSFDKKPKYEYISKMEILISDDSNIANNVKRAVIKMGEFYGISIRDGDKF